MIPFTGFPAGKTRFTPLPDLFFTALLPAIDDLAELKLTLYMFWLLNRQRGYPRYMTQAELEAESLLLTSLQRGYEGDPLVILRKAVEKAVARGSLLRVTISDESQRTDYLFLNTPQGRKAVEQVKSGELVLETKGYVHEAPVERESPGIFELYEQNIGLLQPLLAEELAEAESTYPASWIVDAFRIAAEHNVRNWRYIKSILERWQRDGKDDEGPLTDRGRRRRRIP
jgi:DNA replication protein